MSDKKLQKALEEALEEIVESGFVPGEALSEEEAALRRQSLLLTNPCLICRGFGCVACGETGIEPERIE